MPDEDVPNFVIRLTPPGVGAIAVVRVGGHGALGFLDRFFTRKARPNALVHGELRDGDRIIDDPVVVLDSRSRHADIHLHGGPWVTRACIELATAHGFPLVDAEPISPLAIDSDDPIEREMIAAIPLANTDLALQALLAQPRAWKRLLDRRDVTPAELRSIADDRALHWLLHPPTVAIVGRANVGKSTLANQLFARDRSIVADLPGTTRDWVGELANLDGLNVMLIDTPGLRDTADPIEIAAMRASRQIVAGAELVVRVLDATQADTAPEPVPENVGEPFRDSIVVVNKVDLRTTEVLDRQDVVRTVARTGCGIQALRDRIKAHFGVADQGAFRAQCWTERQRGFLLCYSRISR